MKKIKNQFVKTTVKKKTFFKSTRVFAATAAAAISM